MAASSILKWHSSLQESKSLSRYNAASFYPEMAIFNKARQMQENYYNSGVMVNYLSGGFYWRCLLLCLLRSELYSQFYMSLVVF